MSLLLLFPSGGGGAPPAQALTAARFDNSNTFYSPTVGRGAVTLTASRYDNTQAFYAASVTRASAPQSIQVGLFANAQTFYPSTLTSKVTLSAARFDNAQTFNAHTLTSRVTLTPVRYENAQAFYTAQVNQTIKPGLFTNGQAFYAPVVSQSGGSQALLPGLYENANGFFGPKITQHITFLNWVEPGWVEPGWVEWSYFNRNQFFGAEVTQAEKGGPVHEVEIIDFEPKLWWLRKPKAIAEPVAKEQVKRVAGVIREVVKSTESLTEQKREVKQAIAPLIREMPAFDWVALMRFIQIQVNLERQAEQERLRRLALAEMDEEDALILLLA